MKEEPKTPRSHPDLDRILAAENEADAMKLRNLWAQASAPADPDFPDAEKVAAVWERLAAHAGTSTPPSPMPPRTDRVPVQARRQTRLRWAQGVGVFILLAAIGIFWWSRPITERAAFGETKQVTLADGSQVWLNSGASLVYPRSGFTDNRTVQLTGEAFFDVTKSTHSFQVQTFNATVTVLGTRFNVRAWGQGLDAETTVSLEEGQVALANLVAPEEVALLAPGDTRRVGSDATVSPIDSVAQTAALAWRSGDFIYRDAWLGVLLDDLQRRYAVQIRMEASLRQQRLTFALRQPPSVTAILDDLCNTLNLRYRPIQNGYEIFQP